MATICYQVKETILAAIKKYFLFSLSPGSKQPLPSSVLARKSLSYTLQLRHSSIPSGSSSAPSLQNRVWDQPATTTCCGSMHQPPRQNNRLFLKTSRKSELITKNSGLPNVRLSLILPKSMPTHKADWKLLTKDGEVVQVARNNVAFQLPRELPGKLTFLDPLSSYLEVVVDTPAIIAAEHSAVLRDIRDTFIEAMKAAMRTLNYEVRTPVLSFLCPEQSSQCPSFPHLAKVNATHSFLTCSLSDCVAHSLSLEQKMWLDGEFVIHFMHFPLEVPFSFVLHCVCKLSWCHVLSRACNKTDYCGFESHPMTY